MPLISLISPSSVTASWSGDFKTVNLSWIDNEPSATGYNVERSADYAEYVLLDVLPAGSVNFIDDEMLENDVVYQYKITPLQGSDWGPSGYSPPLLTRNIPFYGTYPGEYLDACFTVKYDDTTVYDYGVDFRVRYTEDLEG